MVLYDEERREEAIALVKEFREKGKQIALNQKDSNISVEKYMQNATENFCMTLIYLKAPEAIELVNLITGKRKVVSSKIQ